MCPSDWLIASLLSGCNSDVTISGMQAKTRAQCSQLSSGSIQMAWAAFWTTQRRMIPSQTLKQKRRRTQVTKSLHAVLTTRLRLGATSIWRPSNDLLQQHQKPLGRASQPSRQAAPLQTSSASDLLKDALSHPDHAAVGSKSKVSWSSIGNRRNAYM